MNTIQKVLLGAGLILGLAGLMVGLSNSANIVSIESGMSNAVTNLGAIASKWTNFAGSGVTTKVGYAFTSSDNSTTTQVLSFVSTGNILTVGVAGGVDVLAPGGTVVTNEVINGAAGFNGPFSTSTALTAAQFCGTTNELWANTTAVATATLPSATSTWALCGSGASFGSWNNNLITNDSTNTINIVAGAGMAFRCETQGVGTDTYAGGVLCTASQVSLLATSTLQVSGYWDNSSSSMVLMFGNMFH
jgi:hypothetical protein